MKKIFVVILLLFATNSYARDCVPLGETYDVPPGQSRHNQCCGNAVASPYYTSLDGSTGYTHFICLRGDMCYKNGKEKKDSTIACCKNLVLKDGICVKKSDCTFDGKSGVLIRSQYSSEKDLCVKFPDCVTSGEIDPAKCQHCCVDSRLFEMPLIPMPKYLCLAKGEKLKADQRNYIEQKTMSQLDVDAVFESCSK